MIAELIPKLAEMESENKDYYPRPSLSGPDRCIRQMVYWGLNTPKKPLAGRAMLIFDDSSWHETLTLDWIRKSAFFINSEQMKVDAGEHDGISLKGSIDAIITDILEVDRLLEHKAINHFTFQKYWDGEMPIDYFTQVCLYLRGLQKVGPDIVEAILLIKNKNTAQYIEYLLRYEGAEFDSLLVIERTNSIGEKVEMNVVFEQITGTAFQKFAEIDRHIKEQSLPKRQYDNDDWHCSYCPYSKTCWENYQQEFQELRTDTELPEEIATMARYFKELGAQESDIKKERDDIKHKIINTLKATESRKGRAGEYMMEIKLVETSKLNKDLLTPAEIERATEASFYEKLNVSKMKGEENGKRV